jgi:hypothetical protein
VSKPSLAKDRLRIHHAHSMIDQSLAGFTLPVGCDSARNEDGTDLADHCVSRGFAVTC